MKRLARSWFLAVFTLAMAIPAFAQLPRLDSFLKGLEEEGTFYGSVLVVKDGSPVFRTACGFADEAKTVRNGPAFVYYASWMNEPMIAALAEMAQERGLLSLDAPIGTYLAPFQGRPAPTLRNLLCHASGLPVFKLNMLLNAQPGTLTLADLASGIAEKPLLEDPGKHFAWMFNNYELAALVLENVTGKPYPELLSEWILKPLGMTRTGAGPVPADRPIAWGPRLADFQKDLALWRNGYRCSMGLHSTVDDLERFFSALGGGRLLPAPAYQDMQKACVQDGPDGEALGFAVMSGGILAIGGHDSSGFQSIFRYDPRYDLRILILANRWMDAEGRGLQKVVVPEVYAALGLKE